MRSATNYTSLPQGAITQTRSLAQSRVWRECLRRHQQILGAPGRCLPQLGLLWMTTTHPNANAKPATHVDAEATFTPGTSVGKSADEMLRCVRPPSSGLNSEQDEIWLVAQQVLDISISLFFIGLICFPLFFLCFCKGNVSCTSYSRTFGYGKLT